MAKKDKKYYYLSLAISGGLIAGTILGVLFQEVAVGSSAGLLGGIFVGLFIEYNKGNISKKSLIKSVQILLISLIGAGIIYLIPILFSYF